MKVTLFLFISYCLCIFSSCSKKESNIRTENITTSPANTDEDLNTLFKLLPSSQTRIDFINKIVPNDSLNILDFNYFYNGGGVAIGDINNDSLPDIYLTGNMVSSKLYLNKGNFQFEEITWKAGVATQNWATGVSMADVNGDGLLDIYVCFSAYQTPEKRANQLFINNGNSTFTEKAAQFGLADTGYSTQAAFFDYDKDSDLDLYLLSVYQDKTNPNLPRPKVKNGTAPSTDKLYRNNGNGTFTNVSAKAGIIVEGYGLGIAVSDINLDGWPDIYVANDFIFNDLLYINNRNGTFSEKAAQYLKHQSRFAMGTDAADINNDGLVDIMVLDMLPNDNKRQKLINIAMNYDLFEYGLRLDYQPQYSRNTLQLNNGNGTFSEIGYLAGVYKTDWSWSALFADYDNDGYRDLLVTNGIPKDITDSDFIKYRDTQVQGKYDYAALKKTLLNMVEELSGVKKPNFIFSNNGDLTFTDKTQEWGLGLPAYSNGAAYADLDKDGDLDLVINNIDDKASVYENHADTQIQNNFLRVSLQGKGPNRGGMGAKVEVRYKGKKQFHEHSVVRGFQSTVENIIHFGLGKDTIVDSLIVIWPDGKSQILENVSGNQVINIDYTDAVKVSAPTKSRPKPVFAEVSAKYNIRYKHVENSFVDYKFDPLLPQKYSQNGPGIAVGDVDGNGLDDCIIGGSTKTPAQLFKQNAAGTFTAADLPDKEYEDMGLLLFDADNDADLDLYVVSGGSEFNAHTAPYQDRLYKNDGKGNFQRDKTALPQLYSSGSCAVGADYDKDGDIDLFIGGRLIPGNYPLPARSYLLRNDGGKFTDVTAQVSPSLQNTGLITSALWTDFDNDKLVDLIVTGEWMPIRFFKNANGKLIDWNADKGTRGQVTAVNNSSDIVPSLSRSSGWWNSITGADFDQDGDTDYMAGNLGLNARYKASPQEPVTLYSSDFDMNGKIDPILAHYINGKNYPAHSRDALIDQIAAMRKRFPKYADFANATMDDIFSRNDLQRAYIVKSEYFPSSYIENLGEGKFQLKPLPVQAQFAPIFGIVANDYNNDGFTDLLVSGNSHATEFTAGWYDASIGLYLQGDGKGNFIPVNNSGFFVDGDAKSMATLQSKNNQELILAASNADSLKVFEKINPSASQVIRLLPMDAWAEITYANEKKAKIECYYGSGYLSQSSRTLRLSPQVKSVVVFNFAGQSRKLR